MPDPSGTHVFLSLGSNLGDRKAYLKRALSLLGEGGFSLEKVSSLYETSPEGCEDGAKKFLNLVSAGFWKGDAHSLLALCKKVETALG
ncbi:MAG: 2-amino-4-hydroxy-6-hydroxymethyldihydropteridine diphosphokinase, partial [Lentisphaeria bacterium]|nr:2-amino-4-hydroxy-6-hydroxymethyldihydropteridine diphosphokinase [Lentisphaeria bacterium]